MSSSNSFSMIPTTFYNLFYHFKSYSKMLARHHRDLFANMYIYIAWALQVIWVWYQIYLSVYYPVNWDLVFYNACMGLLNFLWYFYGLHIWDSRFALLCIVVSLEYFIACILIISQLS